MTMIFRSSFADSARREGCGVCRVVTVRSLSGSTAWMTAPSVVLPLETKPAAWTLMLNAAMTGIRARAFQ